MADSAIRTVGIMVWRIVSTAQAGKSPDIAYYLYFTTLQSHLEIWLGMIGATLPTLAPIKSKLIMPAISSLLASYRKSVKPIGSQQRESSVAEGVDDGVQLQRSGLNRLHEESLVEFGRYQHWVSAEGAGKDGDEENGWIGSPGVIRVGHELDVVAEPRHPV